MMNVANIIKQVQAEHYVKSMHARTRRKRSRTKGVYGSCEQVVRDIEYVGKVKRTARGLSDNLGAAAC